MAGPYTEHVLTEHESSVKHLPHRVTHTCNPYRDDNTAILEAYVCRYNAPKNRPLSAPDIGLVYYFSHDQPSLLLKNL